VPKKKSQSKPGGRPGGSFGGFGSSKPGGSRGTPMSRRPPRQPGR
jgi:hypothetical protein